MCSAIGGGLAARVDAEDLDLAGVGSPQAEDRAHQHRLARARAADHAQDLAGHHVEVQAVVDDLVAELVDQSAHADDRFGFAFVRQAFRYAMPVTSPSA